MKILFVSRWFPYPADNGSRLRVLNLIRHLAKAHSVSLVSFSADPVSDSQIQALHAWCHSVRVVPYQQRIPNGYPRLSSWMSPMPRSLVLADNSLMRASLAEAVAQETPDVAIASELGTAPYVAELSIAVRLLEDLEVGVIHGEYTEAVGLLRKARHGLTWWKLRRYLRELLGRFHACTVVSDIERDLVQELAPVGLELFVVPNAIAYSEYQGLVTSAQPDTLIYPGALTYNANLDAVRFFVAEVLPLIVRERPQVMLRVTGSVKGVPPERIPRAPQVIYTGRLADVRPEIARSWVVPIPLRIGSGTRLKILEALALGVPVVSTPKGVAGLDLAEGEGILIADGPEAIARSVLRVLADASLRQRLAARGRAAVAARYDWAQVGVEFTARVHSVASRLGVSIAR